MANKKPNFTQQETAKYGGIIGGIGNVPEPQSTIGRGGRRSYNTGDSKKDEYRFACRMPAEYGVFLQEYAWMKRTTITNLLQELVYDAMKQHPEVFESLDSLNRK